MTRMTGGQALVRSLHREGVRVMFGLPGQQLYHAVDALYDEPGIRFFTTRHEQATTYMADGYARVTGDIAAALVVSGPGLLNASAGIATAYAVSSPVLVLTGEARWASRQGLDDARDEINCIRPITKWASRARSPAEIPVLVHEAVRQLRTGRPQPVAILVARETLAAEVEVDLLEPERYDRPAGSPDSLRQAAGLLSEAQRPAILAGGGVMISGASDALQRLAEHLHAPVVTTPAGKGAISDRHDLSLGLLELRYAPLREWLAQRDVLLAVGTRLDLAGRLPQQPIIRIDVDAAEIGHGPPNTVGIVGDARRALEELHGIIAATVPARPGHNRDLNALRAARFGPEAQLEPQASLMQAIRAAIPDDGILVPDMTQLGYYSRNYYPVYQPRTYLTPSYYGTLGFAFPTALGAKVARPDRAVVAVVGDGGFLYNSQELATAVQYGINVVVIVFNDQAYGNVLRAQMEEFGGRIFGTRLQNPDFVKLAAAYGVRGVRAEDAAQLEVVLREALTIEAPTLIEVPVGMMGRRY